MPASTRDDEVPRAIPPERVERRGLGRALRVLLVFRVERRGLGRAVALPRSTPIPPPLPGRVPSDTERPSCAASGPKEAGPG